MSFPGTAKPLVGNKFLIQATVSLDCDQATMVTQHGKPMFTKVTFHLVFYTLLNGVKYL